MVAEHPKKTCKCGKIFNPYEYHPKFNQYGLMGTGWVLNRH